MRSRRDVFRVRKCRRTYDRAASKFSFNIEYETHTVLTSRSLVVAEAFGLGVDDVKKFPVLDAELKIAPGDIVLVTGDSGSGKSVLLRAIKEDLGTEAVDMGDLQVVRDKPLIEIIGATVEEGLELLSKVGLNDAFLFLRTYDQLSDGQRWRYRLAKFLESGKPWWLLDEFAATLDRDTAKIIAFNVQKLARQQGKTVIAATTHNDLFVDLGPSVHVHKRFGKEIAIDYFPNSPVGECSLIREMRVEGGNLKDWRVLSCFHYRSHSPGATREVYRIMRGAELCGVIIYAYPPPGCQGRRLVLPKMSLMEMNEKLSIISRIVIHPKYRTIGLGAKIIRETLPRVSTPFVEMVAVMAKYNPFAERAGLRRVHLQAPCKEVRAIAEVLSGFGFDLKLLGSDRYIRGKLEALAPEQMADLKECFVKNDHPKFRKQFAAMRHVPYGSTKLYQEGVRGADLVKMVTLVRILGVLLQSKVYLFWSRDETHKH